MKCLITHYHSIILATHPCLTPKSRIWVLANNYQKQHDPEWNAYVTRKPDQPNPIQKQFVHQTPTIFPAQHQRTRRVIAVVGDLEQDQSGRYVMRYRSGGELGSASGGTTSSSSSRTTPFSLNTRDISFGCAGKNSRRCCVFFLSSLITRLWKNSDMVPNLPPPKLSLPCTKDVYFARGKVAKDLFCMSHTKNG